MTTIAELENQLAGLSAKYHSADDLKSHDAYKDPANRHIVVRLVLRKNILKWHQRLASLTGEHFNPSEKSLHDAHVREARADVLRECTAALKAAGAEDKDFIQVLIGKHEAGEEATAILHHVQAN